MIDPDELPDQENEQGAALIDPRDIHPAPEGLFTDGTETAVAESGAELQAGESPPERDARGMVDPRSEVAGPDI